MTSRGGVIRLAVLALIVAGLTGMWASSAGAQPSPCVVGTDCDNEMSVGTGGPVAIGATATVPLRITLAGVPWQGYGGVIEFTDTIVANATTLADYTGLGGTSLDAAPTVVNDGGGVGLDWLKVGSAKSSGTTTVTGIAVNLKFTCLAAGTTTLRLVPPAGAINNSSTLGVGGVKLETGLTAGSVKCEQLADVTVSKTGPASVVAGAPFDWVTTVHNAGPNPAPGVIIGDNLPENPTDPQTPPYTSTKMKIFNSVSWTLNGNPLPAQACVYVPLYPHPVTGIMYSNIVLCDLSALGILQLMPSDTVVLTVNVTAPLYDAGKMNVNVSQAGSLTVRDTPLANSCSNTIDDDGDTLVDAADTDCVPGVGGFIAGEENNANEADCALTGLPAGNLGCAFTQVADALVTISKVANGTIYSEGDTITWTVTVSCGALGSPCADATGTKGPVITDTLDANQTLVSATLNVAGICVANVCTPAAPMAVGSSVVMTVVATVVGSVGNACVNNASATFADPATVATGPVSVLCFPPTVRMQKDLSNPTDLTIDSDANLWLCEEGPCDGLGEGDLNIAERVFNVANDPDGAGAYEFQIKFDHKIFDINVEDSGWLNNGGTRVVNCSMSVVTENWILWGCVSTDAAGPPPAPGIGNGVDGIIANIHVLPESDLKYRLTPGNDNGIFRVILDENCEIADPLGHPLELPGWASDGLDNDGDTIVDEFGEGLAPGVVTGGLIEECSDAGITVRILEGDLNLDCAVDVLDEQAIAFRYGSSFGVLLYDPWFDLEPWVKDFDIDIKDLQKVFGRDGSDCQAPIPAQDPVPFP